MKGKRVELLQQGLNREFGAGLVTDGMWGGKTQGALEVNKVPTPITANAWQQMLQYMQAADPYSTGGSSTQGTNMTTPSELAEGLAVAKAKNDFKGAKLILDRMQTAQDYKNVRDQYQARYGRTVVDAMLGGTSPWSPSQKAIIRNEFIRMGLQYDRLRDRWSLPSGLSGPGSYWNLGKQAVTIRDTTAWDIRETPVSLPAGVVLGMVMENGPRMTMILTPDGEELFVDSSAVVIA